jgi:predicted permease
VLARLFDIVAPIYVVAGLGWWWAWSGRRYDTPLVTDLIMTIGAPSLVFASLTGLQVPPAALATMAMAAVAAFATLTVVGAVALRALGLPRHTYLGPVVFMNVGNLGLPVCLFAFGEPGLALGVVFFAVGSLLQFTVGLTFWAGRLDVRGVVRTPLAWAAVLALVSLVTGHRPPEWIVRTTTVLGGLTIPLMQFTLGVSLGQLGFASLDRTFTVTALRLGLGLGVGLALAAAFGLEGVARGVFIVDCAMPVAVFNYLLAQRYDRAPEAVAGLVVVSTFLAFVTVPLLLAVLL